ncbi:MAG TPA: FkbM family methyltransferase [Planctomycetota bacterium]|nr:FkbM family methyltransferase [Planctomycetota bacterium]
MPPWTALGRVSRRMAQYLRHDFTYHTPGERPFWIAFDAAYYLIFSASRKLLGKRRTRRLKELLPFELAYEWATLPNTDRLRLRRVHRAVIREVYDEEIYGRVPLRPGDGVIDAGAHWGVFTTWAARRVGPTGHVIAVEPDPINFAELERNVRRNGLTNVTLVQAGLWDVPGKGSMTQGVGPRAAQMEQVDPSGGSLALLTLDEVLERHPLPRLRMVKVDVEGAELRVLRGGSRAIAQRPHFAMEIHPEGCDADALEKLLRDAGYAIQSTRAEDGEGHLYMLWATAKA